MLLINKRYARRLALGLIALVLAMTVLGGCAKKGSKTAVATYKDGGKVTQAEFDKYIGATKFFYPMYAQYEGDPAFEEHMVKQLVAFRLLGARADEAAKKDAGTKTKDQMTQIKDYFNQQGKDALKTQLKELKVTEKDLEDYVLQSLTVLSSAELKVTDDQMKASYEEKVKNKELEITTVSHILVMLQDETGKDIRKKEDALKRAQEVKDKLDKGGDFAALAKEYSDDPGSKDNGGKYEDADPNQWVDNFKNAALNLPLNKISDPIETEYGYHVMRVDARKTKTFDELKVELKSVVAESQITDFMEKELPSYDIKYLKATPTPSETPSASPAK
ncbi:peptidylprolyl isomerase [Paenibacillus koleovorans]|uniref:peptidylprolyl isomerase n=1 Tax=Paenibacillus koleovorans TaxID=121608 RepID=UPI000FDCC722|nr:peptidylprolyl isomerase [Paenibacillus koleovorans]